MAWALVFSGQGLQHPGMLPWLERDEALESLEALLGTDWRDRLSTHAGAASNRRAQVLLTASACAAWAQLQAHLPPPAIIAGYSVGELAAFAAAGVFDLRTALELAGQRAGCMDRAAQGTETGLLGVSRATPAGLDALCLQFGLDTAIRIDLGSAVLGGRRPDLRAAADQAAARGWRCTPLNVEMASHTPWMQAASEGFDRVLAATPMAQPARPLCSNSLGHIRHVPDARRALSSQISQTVRWDDCMDAIAAQRVSAVLEIGPGQALARLWQERYPDVPARSADEFRSARAIASWLGRHQAV